MEIEVSSFNVSFPKIDNIRREAFRFEDRLGDVFATPFQVLPIPNDAPAEIPRITANSHNGHSQLAMSQIGSSFETRYTNGFRKDWSTCVGYLEPRLQSLYQVLDDLIGGQFLFCGLTTKIIFPMKTGTVLPHLVNSFFRVNKTPFDINGRFVFVEDDRYYLNIEVSNSRLFATGTPVPEGSIPPLRDLTLVGEAIEVVLDINDRYAFNFKAGYTSSWDAARSVLDRSVPMIKGKLERFVMEGVWS